MNLGELKLQNFFFNSQLQLNNDLLNSGKSSSSFDEILKNKSIDRSEVGHETRYKGFTNATMDKEARVRFNNGRSDFNPHENVGELKTSIKEGIAQKKFEKESGLSETGNLEKKVIHLKNLQEKIKSLEEAIQSEVAKPEDADELEKMAAMMGVEVEALIEQLTQLESPEQMILVEKIVDFLNLELVEPETLVKELTQMTEILPEEKLVAFENVLKQLVEKIPEGDHKEMVVALEQLTEKIAIENVVSNVVSEVKTEDKTEVVAKAESVVLEKEVITKETTTTSQPTDSDKKEAEIQLKVVEVKTDQSKQDQTQEQKEQKPILSLETKIDSKTGKPSTIEEQVNVMKYDASVISSTKEQPKVVLARSVMNQVIQGTKMSINMSDQGSEILIKLNPKNLGNVALKMIFDKGTLMAQIQVENQTVKAIIQSNLTDLKNALKQEGYIIGELDVSVNKENTGQGEQGFSQRYKKTVVTETFEEVEERITLQKNVVNDKVVDYLA